MKKKLSLFFIITLLLLPFISFNTTANATEVSNSQNEFSVKFSRADYYDFNPTPENAQFPGRASVGNYVHFTADVSNAVGTVTYKYHVSFQGGPEYSIPETTSTSPDYLWIPKHTGIYCVEVVATDEAGHIASNSALYAILQ